MPNTQNTQKTFFPIVGAHFRPPAKFLLSSLAAGARLGLEPEPENPYDAGAVKVLIDLEEYLEHFPELRPELEKSLGDTGFLLEDLLGKIIHLGYLPKTGAKTAKGGPGNLEWVDSQNQEKFFGELGFGIDGSPGIWVEI